MPFLLHTTLKFCNVLLCKYLYACSVNVDTVRTLHGYAKIIRLMQVMADCRYPSDFFLWMALYCLPEGQDNAIPKHKTLRREPSSDSLNHQKEIELSCI